MGNLDDLNHKYGGNSRQIGFRINRAESSQEAKALDYLEMREAQGDKPRQIIVEALAAMADSDNRLNEVLATLKRIETQGVHSRHDSDAPTAEPGAIPPSMINSLLNLRKPTKRLEE